MNTYEHFKLFWSTVYELGKLSGQSVPAILTPSRVFSDGGTTYSSRAKPCSFLILRNLIPTLAQSDQIDQCLHALIQDGLLTPPRTSNDRGDPVDDPKTVKQHLIGRLLQVFSDGVDKYGVGGLYDLPDTQLQKLYENLKGRPLHATRAITVPLKNFTMGSTPIVADGVELGPFPGQEKTILWEQGSLDYSLPTEEFARSSFRLMGHYNVGDTDDRFRVENVAESFIDTLRLLKRGDVGAMWSFDHGPSLPGTSEFGAAEMADYQVKNFGETYAFLEADIPVFQQWFQRIRSQRKSRALQPLETGIRRFNQSYGRRVSEDQMIDWVVALENTLLANVESELKYRLGLRGAALLSKHRDPADTQKLLGSMYDIRSKIVHEGRLVLDPSNTKLMEKYCAWPLFMPECQNLLRLILREYIARIEQGKSIGTINDDLDRQVVNGLKPREDKL